MTDSHILILRLVAHQAQRELDDHLSLNDIAGTTSAGRREHLERAAARTRARLVSARKRRPDLSITEDSRPGEAPTVPGQRDRLDACYPAHPSSVSTARHAIAEFAAAAGAPDELTDAIRLAASEAVTNAVKYAYTEATGVIYVDAWVAQAELWVLIVDEGRGLRAGAPSDGLGLGLVLISELADEVWVVDSSLGGTEVRMRFELQRRRNQSRGSGRLGHRPRDAALLHHDIALERLDDHLRAGYLMAAATLPDGTANPFDGIKKPR